MTPEEVLASVKESFANRKFAAGLLVAMIDLLLELDVPSLGASSFADVLAEYPRQTTVAGGRPANTLVVDVGDGKTLSLRPFYNKVERHFHVDHKRFGYPSCAPHATQAWTGYENWLDALSTFSETELTELRQAVIEFVVASLPSHEFDPASVELEPPLFKMLIEDFDLSKHKGEVTGAAYQGVVFGFLRADNPHLQVEIDKVRTGSRRRQRVGDIDAWEGARLAITAEVKQFELTVEHVPDLEKFANEAARRGSIGMVVALSFAEGARDAVIDLGVHALDADDMLGIVELWDPMKQRTAVASLVYYVEHVERNKPLAVRLKTFLEEQEEAFDEERAEALAAAEEEE